MSEAEQASSVRPRTSQGERREDPAPQAPSRKSSGESRSRMRSASRLSNRRVRRRDYGSTAPKQPVAAGSSSSQQPPDEAKRGQASTAFVETSPPTPLSQEASFCRQETTLLQNAQSLPAGEEQRTPLLQDAQSPPAEEEQRTPQLQNAQSLPAEEEQRSSMVPTELKSSAAAVPSPRPEQHPQGLFSAYGTAAWSPLSEQQAVKPAAEQDASSKAGSPKVPDDSVLKTAPMSSRVPGKPNSGTASLFSSGNASPMVHSFWSMFSSNEYRPALVASQNDYLMCMGSGVVAAALILLAFFVAAHVTAKPKYVEVRGPFGAVRGVAVLVEGRLVHAFNAIPYAAAPVGPLRFARPVPPQYGTTIDGIHQRYTACPQPRLGNTGPGTGWIADEDCLRVNIWIPTGCGLGTSCSGNKTVLVFITGSLFQQGDAGDVTEDGSILAALGDIAVVTFAYRLGALGFLCTSTARDSGNMGLYDQLAAMEWVHKNIAYFGGNHSEIVVAGHGSGAVSVGLHMLNPNSGWMGYVKRFIVMSNSPYSRQIDGRAEATNKTAALSRELGCADPADDVVSANACLRSVSVTALLEASSPSREHLTSLFFPAHGTDLMPVRPSDLPHVATLKSKQVLIGHTTLEGVHQAALFRNRVAGSVFEASLEKDAVSVLRWLGVPDPEKVVATYAHAASQHDMEWMQSVFGTVLSACPVHYFTEHLARNGANAVYAYIINHTLLYERLVDEQDRDGDEPEAHFEDLGYIFGLPLRSEYSAPKEEKDYSRSLIEIWANFSKSGQLPTVQGQAWPTFHLENQTTVELAWPERVVSQDTWRAECEALRKHLV
ncbi:acetylcholinesterase-1-like isoform X1 [Dermacentor variabilis]|uniref:acetylcholinesterase-1-like isoform X1 n=1 Tax=Dermacentor variabilis TaxID=34621 RepID=UPI003F5B58BB